MAFPTSSLTNNQVHKEGNRAFVYDSALGVWDQVRETDRTENKILQGEIGGTVSISSGATFPAGHVIQTIEINNLSAGSATTSNTLQRDTGLTGTINNVLASSHVLIFSQCGFATGAGNHNQLNCSFGLFRETTAIMEGATDVYYMNAQSGAVNYGNLPVYWSHLDRSPATGTNNYYQGYKAHASYSIYIRNSYRSLIMMEIAQ